MSDLKRCYEILEITPGSTFEEAKLAFRDMVSIWHPDKFSHNSRLSEKAEEKLKLINAAWEQLQEYFSQKEKEVEKQPCRVLAESVKDSSAREGKPRQKEGKAVRAECSFADLDFEPIVPLEQARKAYRHRFHSRRTELDPPDSGAPQGADDHTGRIPVESGFRQEIPVGMGGVGAAGQPGHEQPSRVRGEGDTTRRQPDEHAFCEKKTGMGKQHDKDNEPAQGRKAALHSTEVSFNESDRKIKLLSDSYWLGFLEKKFVNWQQREREEKKQQDAAKDLARKNKILADLYRTRYKAWLIKEKSKYNSFPIISNLFKRNTSLAGENSRKFPFGVPDIALEFIKGGSFLIGNDAGNIYLKTPGRNSEQPYRAVTVNDFYVGRYPVTMRQWSKAMGVEVEGAELDSPVQLNWDGVQEFISRLNGITGLEFRIPTEAEWEYAGRSGGKNEDLSELADGATNNSTASRAGRKVGQCKPNALGLFDMLGNSGEWVSGSSTRQTRRTIPQGTSRGAGNSGRQVIRGAVHRDLHVNLHFSYAFQRNFPPADKVHRYSFRLAHSSL